jgi:hypothetical protein
VTDLIFATIHGSRLYGLDHEGSDQDHFWVTTSTRPRARQTVTGDQDIVRVGLSRFLSNLMGGSHQSVEALFSPFKVWGENPIAEAWRPFLESFKITGPEVSARYERTIKTFCFGDFKRRRHAVRLGQNLRALQSEGRFNPRMTDDQIEAANRLARLLEGYRLWETILPPY